jgi:hypothetical protein
VALSTIKEEYISFKCMNHCGFTKLLTDLLDHEMDPMSHENLVFPYRLKYDEMKYSYSIDMMQVKIIHMQYLPTHEKIADIFTKLTS